MDKKQSYRPALPTSRCNKCLWRIMSTGIYVHRANLKVCSHLLSRLLLTCIIQLKMLEGMHKTFALLRQVMTQLGKKHVKIVESSTKHMNSSTFKDPCLFIYEFYCESKFKAVWRLTCKLLIWTALSFHSKHLIERKTYNLHNAVPRSK